MKKTIFIFLLLNHLLSYGQLDSVRLVFKDGSEKTMQCKLGNNNKVKCYENKDSDPIVFGADILNKAIFIKDTITTEYHFLKFKKGILKLTWLMEVVTEGELTLYQKMTYAGGSAGYELVVKKENEEFATYMGIGSQFTKSRAKKYFSDCPDIIDKIKKRYFKRMKAIEITEYYNNNCR